MAVPRTELYFLYRTNPLRVLYEGGAGFREPPHDNRAAPLRVWFFYKATAMLLLRDANRRFPSDPMSYAKRSQLRTVLGGRTPNLDTADISRAAREMREARSLA